MLKRTPLPVLAGWLAVALAFTGTAPAFAGAFETAPIVRPGQTCLTRKQKVVLLVGAAALAYLYFHHKNKQGLGPNGQYYRSKNGRIYYRDANHQVHWVTPPAGGIPVPAGEAQRYQGSRV